MQLLSKKKGTKALQIFLDVDGVLNKESDWNSKFCIDRKCVEVLSDIVTELSRHGTTAELILCSTWRAGKGEEKKKESSAPQYEHLRSVLYEYGLIIHGATPISAKGRQAEIEYYIRRNDVSDYIVLDDDISLFAEPDKLRIYEENWACKARREENSKHGDKRGESPKKMTHPILFQNLHIQMK